MTELYIKLREIVQDILRRSLSGEFHIISISGLPLVPTNNYFRISIEEIEVLVVLDHNSGDATFQDSLLHFSFGDTISSKILYMQMMDKINKAK